MGNARMKPECLAKKLSLIRENLKLTQMEMAEELSNEKVTLRKSDVSRYESGLREPSLMALLRYARLAGVTMEMLVDDEIEFLGNS